MLPQFNATHGKRCNSTLLYRIFYSNLSFKPLIQSYQLELVDEEQCLDHFNQLSNQQMGECNLPPPGIMNIGSRLP